MAAGTEDPGRAMGWQLVLPAVRPRGTVYDGSAKWVSTRGNVTRWPLPCASTAGETVAKRTSFRHRAVVITQSYVTRFAEQLFVTPRVCSHGSGRPGRLRTPL